MKRTYFAYQYHLNHQTRYLIWFTADEDDADGTAVAPDDIVPSFVSIAELVRYAEIHHLEPLDITNTRMCNLDTIAKWLKMKKMKRVRRIDCAEFLAAWNLFEDISHSLKSTFDPDHALTQKIYDKLFYGNNLPVITPEGKFYIPLWTGRELVIIHHVMKTGLEMFRTHVKRP